MAALNIPLNVGTAQFLVSEANGYRSRESVTAALGAGKLLSGMVMARLTADAGAQKAGQFVPWVSGGSNGTGTFAGILYEAIDATAVAVDVTVVCRDAEIQRSGLVFAGTPDAAAKNAAYTGMAALGLALR